MSLVAISTQPTALVQEEYLEPATVTCMLFCIENAVQTGLTTPSKTIVLCMWNIPKGQRVDTSVKPARDLVFEKSVYTEPKSKSVKLANDKKRILGIFPNCDKSRETKG